MADFIAGYISGAISILVGNPLDVLKTRLQASSPNTVVVTSHTSAPAPSTLRYDTRPRISYRDALRGIAAPVVTYGALNAVLFATYNRSLAVLNEGIGYGSYHGYGHVQEGGLTSQVEGEGVRYHPYWTHFAAGCLAGLATFVISAPTEVVKCRTQVVRENSLPASASAAAPGGSAVSASSNTSSMAVAKQLWRTTGVKAFYHGGTVTALRDSIGYGFYYLSYEVAKEGWDRIFASREAHGGESNGDGSGSMNPAKVLLCGGLAGVATWASVFPLDVVKTRVQTQDLVSLQQQQQHSQSIHARHETLPLLGSTPRQQRPLGAWSIAKQAYRNEGISVFFRGLSVCCARAFVVNAVQWAVYEWVMTAMVKVG